MDGLRLTMESSRDQIGAESGPSQKTAFRHSFRAKRAESKLFGRKKILHLSTTIRFPLFSRSVFPGRTAARHDHFFRSTTVSSVRFCLLHLSSPLSTSPNLASHYLRSISPAPSPKLSRNALSFYRNRVGDRLDIVVTNRVSVLSNTNSHCNKSFGRRIYRSSG